MMKIKLKELKQIIKEVASESDPEIAAQLAAKGMREADYDERGWYVTVVVDGEPVKVWATDDDDESSM